MSEHPDNPFADELPDIQLEFTAEELAAAETQAAAASPLPSDGVDPDLVWYYDKLYNDFLFFCQELWKDRGYDDLRPIKGLDEDIIRHAGHGPRKRGVLAPRSYGKTYQLVVTLAAWFLFRNPNHKVVVVSKTQEHAKKIILLLREWIDHHSGVLFLQHLAVDGGGKKSKRKRDTSYQFDVRGADSHIFPSVTAVGVTGQLPGMRAHIVIADDVETEENTKTQDARDALANTVSEFNDICTYEDRFPGYGGEIFYVGTPHNADSLYPKLVDREYHINTWPIRVPDEDEAKLITNLAPGVAKLMEGEDGIKPGEALFPHRLPSTLIAERLAEGPTRFLMQSMLIARVGDIIKYPLRLEDLIILDFEINGLEGPLWCHWGEYSNDDNKRDSTAYSAQDLECVGWPTDVLRRQARRSIETAPFRGTKMHIDVSGRGADETAYAIAGHIAGQIYVMDVAGFAGGTEESGSSEEVIMACALAARKWNVREITIEKNFSGEAFGQLLSGALRSLRIEAGDPDWPQYPDGWAATINIIPAGSTMKESRIIGALEGAMASHRVCIRKAAIAPDPILQQKYELQKQIAMMTEERGALEHDDRVEVMSVVVRHWLDALRISPSQHQEKRLAEAREKRIEEYRRKYRVQAQRDSVIHHRSGASTPSL